MFFPWTVRKIMMMKLNSWQRDSTSWREKDSPDSLLRDTFFIQHFSVLIRNLGFLRPRVHKNKSRQLHTMGSATAEFEVRHRWRTTTLFSGRYALNAEHVHARSLQKLHLFDWHFRLGLHFACTCSSKYSVHRWVQRSRINVFPFLVQTDVGSDDELRILPWQHS